MCMLKKILPVIIGLFLCMILIGFRDVGDFPQKIWLHRCNSIEKLQEKHKRYPNIEVDVVFREDQKFDVTHDIDTSFGLNLASYFSFFEKERGKMWLDIKNLNQDNVDSMLTAMNGLTEQYRICKERLIIESSCWEALNTLTRDGYYTSFYIPYDDPSGLDNEEQEDFMEELQEIADKQAVSALSFPGEWYVTLKEKLDRPIDLLTWQHRSTQLELLLSTLGKKMLFDPQLKVILVKDKGKFHR